MAFTNDERTLYVANLHKNVTEDLLYELFLQAGPVERVSIPKLKSQSFIYGFVTYVHACAVDYALQLYKGTCLFKKKLLIKRKGERRSDQSHTSDRYSREGWKNQEKIQNNPLSEQSHVSKYTHQSSDTNSSSKTNTQPQNIMPMAHKGDWQGRYRPYDRDARRQNSARSANFSSRNRHRNHSGGHNKSNRDRKGRYGK